MKTRGNPSGPGAITTPHLQRPNIRMQPESCHHARDPFAQGLGPYMVAFFSAAPTQAQTSSGNAPHQSQIYGAVQTANMAAGNQVRMDDVTILVRKVKEGRLGKVVG